MTRRLAVVILAGGKGARLGGAIKASVTVGGIRLLERVSGVLNGADTLLVSVGGFDPGAVGLMSGPIAVADLPTDHGGPLAGVAAAVDWCNRAAEPPELLLSVAVDTPFLPEVFVPRMLEALTDGVSAVIASHGGQTYPTNALWRLSAIADLPRRLSAGTAPHSLKRLAADLSAAILDWPASHGGDPFANVNTPDDLITLEARASHGN